MNQKRVGQILREAREEKKLTVKDVSKDTNISVKYILALETEDYAQFPGETFTIGFLKNYGSYLKLDTGMLVNLYRGEKIEESQAPLEELTRPTSSFYYDLNIDKNKIITAVSALMIVIAGFLLFTFVFDGSSGDEEVSEGSRRKLEIPENIDFVNRSLPETRPESFILTTNQGVSFSVSNQQCKLFITGVEQGSDSNTALLGFNVYPELSVHKFKLAEGQEKVLSYSIPEISSLRRSIRIAAQSVTGSSAKVLVSLNEEERPGNGTAQKTGTEDSNSTKTLGDVPIQVTLFFSKPSYAEFIIDGQMGFRGLVQNGETRSLEAKDRLELKVGDGSAVEMIQNGKTKIVLGRPGKLVKKVFVKTPNPYDSTQFIIKELGE
ncbi:DNA-binding helix-turn-helix protein [Leptospira fainei serovar Hurstbridge str. BUT 6]|uniref:DNA-binding helix-turn-helix protein n=1 Tax=Leptospira fainei serovar Hurstbridge str. BUT 6 TaxID=1193011 RepID=S3W410_9LEPT|nr:helix-turn-helix domain-containing protein [Leptospira fainei]EPG75017.1 DNA-binding helix-turn-helix protein [Leptospira fainei serovar Hurstbridge str. BUT 6]